LIEWTWEILSDPAEINKEKMKILKKTNESARKQEVDMLDID